MVKTTGASSLLLLSSPSARNQRTLYLANGATKHDQEAKDEQRRKGKAGSRERREKIPLKQRSK